MWDFADDKHSIKLIESFLAVGKPIGIMCHSTAPSVTSRRQTASFWFKARKSPAYHGEEEAVGLTKIVPFLVEDEMLKLGAVFSKVANWEVHVAKRARIRSGLCEGSLCLGLLAAALD